MAVTLGVCGKTAREAAFSSPETWRSSFRADFQGFSGSERSVRCVLPLWGILITAAWPHFRATRCSCRHHRWFDQIAQADQVVVDHVQAKHRADLFGAAQLELAQTAPLFDPTKHLLDAAAGIDRLGVAGPIREVVRSG